MSSIRREVLRLLLGGTLLAATLSPGVALAASVGVVLDGRPLSFDVPPVIEQNTTMVPVRAVLTPLGALLDWNQEAQRVTATLNGTRIEAVVGSATALVNGRSVTLARPVENREGRTLIPLRFFAEQLGFTVSWEGSTQTVFLASQGQTGTVGRGTERPVGPLVVARAQQLIGLPYAWGGISPDTGFDCSGLVYYVSLSTSTTLPRTSYEQFAQGVAVERSALQPGDLVFFTTYDAGPSHVGVYDGAGGFIHAQSPEVGVVRTPLSSPWWSARYIGARRVFR